MNLKNASTSLVKPLTKRPQDFRKVKKSKIQPERIGEKGVSISASLDIRLRVRPPYSRREWRSRTSLWIIKKREKKIYIYIYIYIYTCIYKKYLHISHFFWDGWSGKRGISLYVYGSVGWFVRGVASDRTLNHHNINIFNNSQGGNFGNICNKWNWTFNFLVPSSKSW